jgi:hypothetical protein
MPNLFGGKRFFLQNHHRVNYLFSAMRNFFDEGQLGEIAITIMLA